jgi:SNF2 family DNA or RNA helicase
MSVVQTKLRTTTSSGTPILVSATLEYKDGRIFFVKSPYSLKDEIKAMRGSRWHGYDEPDPRKIWSVEDCQRNRFQLSFLMGEDAYAWFDRPLVKHEYTRPLKEHQKELTDNGLTYHYHIFAAEMGTGKTLSAQELIERSGVEWWFWVGPKTSLPNIKREFRKWESTYQFRMAKDGVEPVAGERVVVAFTYEGLKIWLDTWKPGDPFPAGMICDESSRCKNSGAQRSQACQGLADLIREKFGLDHGFVIEMSGTPSPKSPVDWWSQCEIAWPGFLREGSMKAMEERMAFMVLQQFDEGAFKKRLGWKDDEKKCVECGETREAGPHELDGTTEPDAYHPFKASKNEVAYLYERLKGLVTIKHKKDCLDLPDKRYRRVICKPSASILRVAEAIAQAAPNAVTAMTLMRELSDGFQYREEQDGMTRCTHCKDTPDGMVTIWRDPQDPDQTYPGLALLPAEIVSRLVAEKEPCPACGGKQEVPKLIRIAREIPCPKDAALRMLLDENEETGRLVVFGGFTGSVDRVVRLCLKEQWNVVRCDQGTFQVFTHNEEPVSEEPLDYWANMNHPRVVYAANPESGGMSLTLVEARTAVYWSNSWKPEYRVQSEDRIHRIGMDLNLGCLIVDLIHLPTDVRVLDVIRENRKLELMTMGELMAGINWESDGEEGTMQVVEAAA